MDEEYLMTSEERAYEHLSEQQWERLSTAARRILGRAKTEASAMYLTPSYSYAFPEEYVEAEKFMDLASIELIDEDRKRLVEIWRAALAAAASIDPEDPSMRSGVYNVDRGTLHRYYRKVSSLVEDTLSRREFRREAEESRRRRATREWDDSCEDIPF